MATNFPSFLDDGSTVGDGTNPGAAEALSSTTGQPVHSGLHQNVGLALTAIESKLGTGASTAADGKVLTGTGSGTSGWAEVATDMIADDAVTAAKIHDDAVTKVVVTDTADATCFPALFESATGSLTPETDAGLTYNASNATLTATTFVGALTGNVTGDASGTAGVATTVTLTDEGSDATCFPVFAQTATGNIALETDASALKYNASNGTLTSTTFVGNLTGNVTGNVTGDVAGDLTGSVLTAAQTAITSVGTLTALTVSGAIVAPSGSAAAPAVQFNDADEGIYGDSGAVIIVASDGARVSTDNSAHKPFTDSAMTLGTSGRRWTTVFADNALNTSDERDKTDVTDLARGLDFVKSLRAVSYKLNKRGNSETSSDVRYGFVAQEIATVLGSDAATHTMWQSDVDEDGVERQSLAYTEFIAPMVKAIQELTARLEALEAV